MAPPGQGQGHKVRASRGESGPDVEVAATAAGGLASAEADSPNGGVPGTQLPTSVTRALIGRCRPMAGNVPSDPAYDEAHVAAAADLASKYGLEWMRRAPFFPGRARFAEHPVFTCVVRHVSGAASLIRAEDMQPLEVGSELFTLSEAVVTSLSPRLPAGLHYFPADNSDFGTSEHRYVTVHFAMPGRLYVLLGEQSQEPKWLREHFYKMREPIYGARVVVGMRWRRMGLYTLLSSLASSAEPGRPEPLIVYRSKRLYRAGEAVCLGGQPSARLTDRVYVVAAAREADAEAESPKAADMRDVWDDGLPPPRKETRAFGTPAATANVADWAVWHSRMIKAIRRNRVDDVKALLQADAWVHRPFRADPLSWLPPDEPGPSPLTSDLAAATHNVELLALLVTECHCQLSMKGLRLMVRRWEEVPAYIGGALEVLLGYIKRSRRPLATVACVLTALRWEVGVRERARNSSTLELRALLRRCQELQTYLLEALSGVVRTGGPAGSASSSNTAATLNQAWLQSVVDPPQRPAPLVLDDYSPLRIAFERRDFQFMASVVLEAYTKRRWLGEALMAFTPREGTRELTVLDPLVLHSLAARLGLCGSGALFNWAMEQVFQLWYLCCVLPYAFCASPRGRWWMRMAAGVAFIVVYNLALTIAEDVNSQLAVMGIVAGFLAGNIVEVAETVAVGYRGSLATFARRHGMELFFMFGDVTLFIVTILHLLYISGRLPLDFLVYLKIIFVWASMAIIVYVKFLYTLIPLFRGLGPLLNTVNNMMGELLAFLLPFVVITAGFATAIYVVFSPWEDSGIPTFWDAFLQLFLAFVGAFDTGVVLDLPDPWRTYGIIMMVAYMVIGTILILNLLIAILCYRYRPDESAAQTVFGLAEVVDRHQMQVDRAMLCSPYCLAQLPFSLFPRGTRPAILPTTFLRFWLPPIEGFRPAAPHLNTVPTGRAAVPQLLFLLSLQPLLLVLLNALYYALSPFLLAFFAIHGHTLFWAKVFPPRDAYKRRRAGEGSSRLFALSRRLVATFGGAPSQRTAAATMGGGDASGGGVSVNSGGRRGASSFGSWGEDDEEAEEADVWVRLAKVFTKEGLIALFKTVVRHVAAFLVGVVLVYGGLGLGCITLWSLYVWLACVALSVHDILYEPVVRLYRGVRELFGACRDCGKTSEAEDESDADVKAAGTGAQQQSGAGSGEEAWADGVDDSHMSSGAEAAVAGRTRSGGSAGRGPRLNSSKASRRKAAFARHQQRAASWGPRYLSREQVEIAVLRAFGLPGKHGYDSMSVATAGGSLLASGGLPRGISEVLPPILSSPQQPSYTGPRPPSSSVGGAAGGTRATKRPSGAFASAAAASIAAVAAAGLDRAEPVQPADDDGDGAVELGPDGCIRHIRTPFYNLKGEEDKRFAGDISTLGRRVPSVVHVGVGSGVGGGGGGGVGTGGRLRSGRLVLRPGSVTSRQARAKRPGGEAHGSGPGASRLRVSGGGAALASANGAAPAADVVDASPEQLPPGWLEALAERVAARLQDSTHQEATALAQRLEAELRAVRQELAALRGGAAATELDKAEVEERVVLMEAADNTLEA